MIERKSTNNRGLFSEAYRNEQHQHMVPVKKWRIGRILWRALKRTCTFLGALVLISALISAVTTTMALRHTAPTLPDKFVLFMPIEQGFIEHQNEAGPYDFKSRSMTVRSAVAALEAAAKDKRVEGLVVSLKGGQIALSHTTELRQAIKHFRDAGKFAYIYGSSYDSFGSGLIQYYLASAFDEIWMQPVGTVSIDGLQFEMPMVKNALDKLGVEPNFFARKEYKSVFETFTRSEMSPENRETMQDMVNELSDIMISDIAADRKLSEKALKAVIDKGMFYGMEAVDAGLVDSLNYGDILSRQVNHNVTGSFDGNDADFVSLSGYARYVASQKGAEVKPQAAAKKTSKIALIYITGTIMEAPSQSPQYLLSADNLVKYINQAKNDKSIDAVVVRVNSPGGTPTAAEKIRRALLLVKQEGKPVIISMGGMAASGGYWVSADADHIFALPSTLTGSIGVAGGKFAITGLWEKLGVTWGEVSYGANAGYMSMNNTFNEFQTQRYNKLMDYMYDSFVNIVSAGRGMSVEAVDEVARGRVWTGRQAVEKGLVDELGTLNDSLDYTARELGAQDRHGVSVVVLPKARNVVEQLVQLLQQQAGISRSLSSHSGLIEDIGQVLTPLRMQQQAADMYLYQPLGEKMFQ